MATLFLAFGLALAALAVYVGGRERAAVAGALVDQLRKDTALLADAVPGAAIAANRADSVDAWADHVGGELEHRVTVIAADGRVLGDSQVELKRLATLENHADRPEVRAARA